MLQPILFATNSYVDRSLPVSTQDLVNFYPEVKPPDSKSQLVLYPTPGLTLLEEIGTGPIRGMLQVEDTLYLVSGTELYRVDDDYVATLAGVVSGMRPVSMARTMTGGVDAVAVVSDFDCYYATETTFGTLSISNQVGVAVLDGYALFAQRDSQRFQISAINDVTSIDPTEFTLANAYPDNLVAIAVSNREAWLFGKQSIQVYYNAGFADFPFARTPSGVIQRGCAAPRSVAEYQGALFWLGDDLRVYVASGYLPTPISTAPIERDISEYTAIAEATGYVYVQDGHIFYVLTFNERTWVYDVSTQRWHRRESDGLNNWRAGRIYNYAFNRHTVGDTVNGKIYKLDQDATTDNGATIRRTMISPPISGGRFRSTMHELFLDMETGVGLTVGQGSDPQVMLDWSDDGGFTYGTQLWVSAGAIGDRRVQVHWHRLGQFRQRTLRITLSDPVKWIVIGAEADIEAGDE